jgi:hypothetical protein
MEIGPALISNGNMRPEARPIAPQSRRIEGLKRMSGAQQSFLIQRSDPDRSRLLPGMIGTPNMPRQLVRVEMDRAQLAGRVALGLIVEVRRLRIAAFPPTVTAHAFTLGPNSTTATELLPLDP